MLRVRLVFFPQLKQTFAVSLRPYLSWAFQAIHACLRLVLLASIQSGVRWEAKAESKVSVEGHGHRNLTGL
jgi:hypothetical protein